MRQTFRLVVAGLLISASCFAQSAQSAAASKPAVGTDVYHVHFNKSALGKAGDLGKLLSTPDSSAQMPDHFVVLRHQDGDDWDYCVIQHMGTKATVDATPSKMAPTMRDLSAWHGDTFVSGPSWAEFAKAMGTGDASKSGKPIYIVSVYRAAPGHRDQLEKMLTTPAQNPPVQTGQVLMQHLEGGPWNLLTITRYNSWADLATDRAAPSNEAGWTETREHVASHHDTIADRIAPK